METIQFLICTIDNRIQKAEQVLMTPIEGVSYLISWQQSKEWLQKTDSSTKKESIRIANSLKERKDVYIIPFEGKGLSKNRNHALTHATGDLLIISDDDCKYTEDSVKTIRNAFAKYPETTLMQFQGTDLEGKLIHSYTNYTYLYDNRPYGTYFSSWELVVKRVPNLPKFDERFGIGAYLGCGEEEVFVHQIAAKGLIVRYVPKVIVRTQAKTTGTLFTTEAKVRRAKGGVSYLIHGYLGALLRCIKYALKLKSNRLKSFLDMYDGIKYLRNGSKQTNIRNHSDL